jgi:cell division protein FtsB
MTIYFGVTGWKAPMEAFTFAAGVIELNVRTTGKGLGGVQVSKVANYWVDERIRAQRVAPRTSTSLASVQQISIDILGTRTEVRRRGGIIPSWVVFGMILLATLAVCVTVNMRTRAKVHVAAQQLSAMQTDVEALRNVNQSLKTEVQKLRTDPRTIELAARARLNMVRSNEYVVPVE